MEPKGFQLIEPNFTSPLILYMNDELTIAIMCWLIDEVKQDPTIKSLPIELDVVTVYRYEKYPCIGLHYLNDTEDVGLLVEQKLEEIYRRTPFLKFYDYIVTKHEKINKKIQDFKDGRKA